MTTRLLLFLALCVSSIAQTLTVNNSAFVGTLNIGPYPAYPTNIGSPVAWYNGDTAVFTGGTNCVQWNDSYTNGWHLTNGLQYSKGPTSNSLNGHITLNFDAVNDFLRKAEYTNTQPHEIWAVFKHTGGTNGVNRYFFAPCDATAGLNSMLKSFSETNTINLNAGTTLISDNAINFTNRWFIWTIVFNGANSSILTNNVLLKAGNAGTANMSGLTVNSYATLGTTCPGMEVAEIATYSATNTGADRLTLYRYFTNKYNLP